MKKIPTTRLIYALPVVLLLFSACTGSDVSGDQIRDWRSDWALADSLTMEVDATGFNFPTAIAFVPNPGEAPDDPLYYVTELGGVVKVVSNDRSVHVFATDVFAIPNLLQSDQIPPQDYDFGVTGICLEPVHGYIFVTMAGVAADGARYNRMVRFESQPHTFALTPTSSVAFSDFSTPFRRGTNHQIGPCQATEEALFVSIGDGGMREESQDPEKLLGKIIHITLDGAPRPDNPLFKDDGETTPSDFIWASGLRNPFGLSLVGDRLFVADNGENLDRFLEIFPGENYGWDGSDLSIGAFADIVIEQAPGLAQMDYYAPRSGIFPQFDQGAFFVATAGNAAYSQRPGEFTTPSILSIYFDLVNSKVPSPPEFIVKYQGDGPQSLAGLALGPDGLYFATIFPDANGTSTVYRLTYDTQNAYPYKLGANIDPNMLMIEFACRNCHTFSRSGGTIGPALDYDVLFPALEARLLSDDYLETLDRVDLLDQEPFAAYAYAREELRGLDGLDRIRAWLKYRLLEPRFDNPSAQMPNLGLSAEQAEALADFLVENPSLFDRIRIFVIASFPNLQHRHLVYAFGAGLVAGGLPLSAYLLISRRRKRKSS